MTGAGNMQLTKEQKQFCIETFSFGLSTSQVVKEFQEFFPDCEIGEKQLYQRIQKIKERNADEIEALKQENTSDLLEQHDEIYFSPLWRARYFRRLLRKVDKEDIALQVKILKELRAEAKLMQSDDLDSKWKPNDDGYWNEKGLHDTGMGYYLNSDFKECDENGRLLTMEEIEAFAKASVDDEDDLLDDDIGGD